MADARHSELRIRRLLPVNGVRVRAGNEVIDLGLADDGLVVDDAAPLHLVQVVDDGHQVALELVHVGAEGELGVERRRLDVVMIQALDVALMHAPARVQLRKVRAEDLVPAEGVEIDAQRLDVDGPVRRPGNSVFVIKIGWKLSRSRRVARCHLRAA